MKRILAAILALFGLASAQLQIKHELGTLTLAELIDSGLLADRPAAGRYAFKP
ncbi:MAG: hypothetical protein RMI80_10305 [Meiothermus sp.]|uniref:hypothetical protein n=1 Tax=Meiothermus sp. TaxID=1955249 RepID=UPI00298F2359|nr:hypothetical protein [Meiothermus sp.]MDW8091790.1 hypothetical protein [Meiothermus sp.]MDW8481553.1 hypothetical protein [Meiothermus sp.]